MTALHKFYEYFGVVGILSVVAWITVVIVLSIGARRDRRYVFLWLAFCLAMIAYVLGSINSTRVSAIRMDRTAEAEALRAQHQEAREEETGLGTMKVRFAEDSTKDRLDIAGMKTNDAAAFSEASGIQLDEPEYKKKGKKIRDASKKDDSIDTEKIAESAVDEETAPVIRLMREPDLMMANRLDRYNLMAVRSLLWICIVFLGWDYLWRFGKTFRGYGLLPISGAWLDQIYPKPHMLLLNDGKPETVRRYLEEVTKKGESFVLFTDQDPWPDQKGIPKLVFLKWTLKRMSKLLFGEPGISTSTRFLFEVVWFGRYGGVVRGADEAVRVAGDFFLYMDERWRTRAVASKTVHWVWAVAAPIAPDALKELKFLAREINARIVIAPPPGMEPYASSLFDELWPV